MFVSEMWYSLIVLVLLLQTQLDLATALGRAKDTRLAREPRPPGSLLGIASDSIGVLFRTRDDKYIQTWLPVGQRVYNGEAHKPAIRQPD